MRKVLKKRLIYYKPWGNEVFYGGEEYDGSIPNAAILNTIHTIGKTTWLWNNHTKELWLLRPDISLHHLTPQYRIDIQQYEIEIPTVWDKWKNIIYNKFYDSTL